MLEEEISISRIGNGTRNMVRCDVVFHSLSHMLIVRTGDIVRFGPSSLDFNTHSGMSTIYGTRANVRKSENYATMSASRRTPNAISATDKTVHGFKRRIMSQVFSDQGLSKIASWRGSVILSPYFGTAPKRDSIAATRRKNGEAQRKWHRCAAGWHLTS